MRTNGLLAASHNGIRFAFLIAALIVFCSRHAQADDLQSMTQDDRQWVMPAKNFANTRFSSLKQITPSNAGQLRVAWSFSVGSNHGQEAAPIVVGDTM
jgi:glucose dehydrogenase